MTRTVALADKTYAALARRKRMGQSFSDVVDELLSTSRPKLASLVGIAADEEHWDAFARHRRTLRQQSLGRVRLD